RCLAVPRPLCTARFPYTTLFRSYQGPSRSPSSLPYAASVAATKPPYTVSLSSSAGTGSSRASSSSNTVDFPAPGGPETIHSGAGMLPSIAAGRPGRYPGRPPRRPRRLRVGGLQRELGVAAALGEGVPGEGVPYGGHAAGRHGQAGHAEPDEHGGEQRIGGGLAADAHRPSRGPPGLGAQLDHAQQRGLPGVEQVGEVAVLAVRGEGVLAEVVGADAEEVEPVQQPV